MASKTKKAQAMLENQLLIPEFGNNEYRTYYVETLHRNADLEKREKRQKRISKVLGIWFAFDVITLIGLVFATIYCCRTIEAIV